MYLESSARELIQILCTRIALQLSASLALLLGKLLGREAGPSSKTKADEELDLVS